MEIIILKSVFGFVAAVAAAGMLFDLGVFSGLFSSSRNEDDRYRYWPVHLFVFVCCISNLFSKDMMLSVKIFTVQQATSVVISFLVKMCAAEGVRGRFFLVSAMLFYACALVVTMYEYMGHAYMASSYIWLYSFVLLSLLSYFMYLNSFVAKCRSLVQENIVREVLKGIISAGTLLPAFASVLVVCETENLYVGVMSGIAMSVLTAFIFLSSFRQDDMLYGRRVKEAASASIRTCMPQFSRSKKSVQTESELQKRFLAYFEEKRPYLNPELSMADVVNALYTNKTYLSRMLNEGMGMNFNQTVNKYRVMHSMELYIANPAMQISEMAEMSGFNSVSTFSLAFRLHVGLAPGDWCKTVRNGMSRSGKEPLVCED